MTDDSEQTAANDPVAAPEAAFRREIDLGDGGGIQVFEAESADALADKLVEAQRNATMKIRDLSRRLRAGTAPDVARPAQPIESRHLTPEEQTLLAEELRTAPAQAVDKILRAATGLTGDEIRQEIVAGRQLRASLAEAHEAESFMAATPEYVPSPENGEAITGYLQARNLAPTARNFSLAYEDLRAGGLLAEPEADGRIAAPAQQRETRPARSGISARDGRAAAPAPASESERLAAMTTREMEQYIVSRYGGSR